MNLFEISTISSAIVGAAAGVEASETVPWSTTVCVIAGISIGLTTHAITLLPGIAIMKLSPGKGIDSSKISFTGATYLFAGAFISPFAAYHLARAIL